MFYALREALLVISEEGIENRWERIEAMGLSMHVPKEHRIATLNTVCVPEGIDEAKVRRRLLEGPGIEIAGGFGPLAGKVFRIGVMGPLASDDNVQLFLKEFGEALKAEGYSI